MNSRKIILKSVSDFDKDVAMISNYTSMSKNIEWPKSADGKALQCIAHIPANIINKYVDIKLENGYAISIFTYYDTNDYFLDRVVYAGNKADLEIVKNNTKVIFHKIEDEIYSLNETKIPFHEMIISDRIEDIDYYGSKIGGNPTCIQNKDLELGENIFVLQLYGGDFPDEVNDIFYLSDSLGYLFIENRDPFVGLFFIQVG